MMPRVRPRISCAPLADLSQTPPCSASFFSVSRRVSEIISATASSTTLRVLENGALNTAIARRAAAVRSIWFVPMQNAPTASRSGAAASTFSVTRVPERMPSSCTPARASIRSASSRAPATAVTAIPAASSWAVASGWMFSSRSAFTGTFHQA